MFSGVMWTAFASIAVVAVVLFVGPFTFFPSLIGNLAARNIQSELGLADTPDVELRNDDAPLGMLVGDFTGGSISIRDESFGGIRTDAVDIELDPFDVDVRESITTRTLAAEEIGGDLRIEVSETEVSRLADSRAAVPVENVELEDGEMVVNTNAPILGANIPVSVRGGVEMEGGELAFIPGSIALAGARLPEEATADILENLEVSFPVEGLPNGTTINEASVENGAVVLTGRMDGLPSGG